MVPLKEMFNQIFWPFYPHPAHPRFRSLRGFRGEDFFFVSFEDLVLSFDIGSGLVDCRDSSGCACIPLWNEITGSKFLTPHEWIAVTRGQTAEFLGPFGFLASVWNVIEFISDYQGTMARFVVYGPQSYDWYSMDWDMSHSIFWELQFGNSKTGDRIYITY